VDTTNPKALMIQPGFVQTMAAYNSEMNRRLYGAAARLPEDIRNSPEGAFWHSIQGTLCHILWGDCAWMSRFAGWPALKAGMKESAIFIGDFETLQEARLEADAGIEAWAAKLTQDWLDGDLVWFSASLGRELTHPRGFLVAHLFNHQTHHRGQAHALITAAGEKTGDTDLFLVV